jgi:hypothetical protein
MVVDHLELPVGLVGCGLSSISRLDCLLELEEPIAYSPKEQGAIGSNQLSAVCGRKQMTNLIVQQPINSSQNPFDSIRRFDEHGNEYWLATELLSLLGYKSKKRQFDTVERAILSCKNQGQNPEGHFDNVVQMTQIGGSLAERSVIIDYKLSRFACYLTAQNGDPRKPEIAEAQGYFAMQTRRAEVEIPALSEKARLLTLENENLKMQKEIMERQDLRTALHGLEVTLVLAGKGDQMVQVDRPTIEVIDARSNSSYKGQTLVQINEHLKKTTGKCYKSGAAIKKRLEQLKESGLIAQVPRSVLADYVPTENLEAVYRALATGDQQQLL